MIFVAIALTAMLLFATPGLHAATGPGDFEVARAQTAGDMSVYFGNLHSHTAYSDGEGTPEQAFQWARDTAKFDFYAVTDHSEFVSQQMWQDTRGRADQFTQDGRFVGLAGFEWTAGVGHTCGYNTSNYTNSWGPTTLESLYDWLAANGGFGQFNHPAKSAGTFNEFSPSGNPNAKRMRLIETGNSGAGNNTYFFFNYFLKALDNGWTVAPTSNQDNHSLKTNCHRTGVIAHSLTRKDIIQAISSRRVFSTDDPDTSLMFKCDSAWMGSRLERTRGKCAFSVIVEDDEDISKVELISNGGQVVATQEYGPSTHVKKVAWSPEVDFQSQKAYYFVRVTGRDTNNDDESHRGFQIALSAPIWLSVPQHDLSIKVQSDRNIVAERPMYFSYKGVWPGGTTEMGVTKPEKSWYLAEGSTWPGFEEYICIQNPGESKARVTVTYMMQYGVTKRQAVLVLPHSRATVDVNSAVGARKDVAARLTSDQPVVVERPMYFSYNGWTGGSTGSAVPAPATQWYLAEGATHPGFVEWLALMNPNAADCDATVTYMFAGGGTLQQPVRVGAHSRKTVLVNDVVGPNKDVSAVVTSSLPIIAERPMYFNYHGAWPGGSSQTGTTSPASSWFFPEGTTLHNPAAGYFDEWISILNPGVRDTKVTLTYMFPGQGVKKVGKTIGAHSRRTVLVNDEVGSDKDVSVRVDSQLPVVVERPMYYNYHGALAGGDVEMGCKAASDTWYFAEGTNREGFEEWLTLQNPDPEQATALITLMLDNGTTRKFTYILPPTSRTTITVNGLMQL
jgi:hypothetical protein